MSTPPRGDCPEDSVVTAYSAGGLSPEERERVRTHLQDCARCSLFAIEVSRTIDSPGASTAGEAEVGQEAPGRYEILGELGSGGQGTVYAAWDRVLDREVALKVPRGENAERFLREARLAARLDHPGIVTVFEIGRRADGSLYAAQRLVRPAPHADRPRTLRDALNEATETTVRLGLIPRLLAVAEAIAYAHTRGIVHRDLKPENVVIGEHGETVVLDWGLAIDLNVRDKGAGEASGGATLVVGTPGYMSPEQWSGEPVDARTDVFALGTMLAELLTGVRPTGRDVPLTPLRERAPTVPPALAAIAEQASAAKREQRYASAAGFAQDLSQWLSGGMVAAYDYALGERIALSLRRHRQAFLFSTAIALVAFAAAAFSFLQYQRTRTALAATLLEKAVASQSRSAWDTAAAYFAASAELHPSLEAQYGLSATYGHSRAIARFHVEAARAIAALAASRDGRYVAVGEDSGRIALYGPVGTVPERLLDGGHSDIVKALAFRNGSEELLSAGDDGRFLRWDLTTGKATELGGTRSVAINALSLSFDGSWAAAVREDGEVELWSLPSGELMRSWKAHEKPAYGVSISPDGTQLVTCSWDHSVKQWTPTGELLGALSGHLDSVLSCAYSPDGKRIASASRDNTVRVWPATGGSPGVLVGHTQKVNAVAWTSNEVLVSTSDDAKLRYWDAVQLQPIPAATEFIEEDGLSLAVSGSRLFVSGGGALLWAFRSADSELPPNRGVPMVLAKDSERRILISRSSGLFVLNSATLQTESTLQERQPGIFAVLPDGGTLCTYDRAHDDITVTRTLEDGGSYPLIAVSTVITGMASAPDGHSVAITTKESDVKVIDPVSGAVQLDLKGHTAGVFDAAFTEDRIFTASYDKTIRSWSRSDGAALTTFRGHWHGVRTVAISPDGKTLASGGWDKTVRLWDLDSAKLRATLNGHEGYVARVAFDPSGTLLASAAWDGTVIIWDVATQRQLVRMVANDSKINALSLSFDGSWAAAVREDGEVELWSLPSGELMRSWKAHEKPAYGVSISPDGTQLVTC
ncbi:MAG: protein kinase domain-containing protein, partial [Myxococcaceae bacterium]